MISVCAGDNIERYFSIPFYNVELIQGKPIENFYLEKCVSLKAKCVLGCITLPFF